MVNMNVSEIMQIDVENLKEKQLEALKEHTVKILKDVIKCVENNEFEKIEKMTCYSPSGDGYGLDNSYINFAYDNGELDIMQMVERMQCLSK